MISLGRLAQMIQQAVQDDLLRYHKTMLVWTNRISREEDLWDSSSAKMQKYNQNFEVQRELAQIKKCIIEIMMENKNGASLA